MAVSSVDSLEIWTAGQWALRRAVLWAATRASLMAGPSAFLLVVWMAERLVG